MRETVTVLVIAAIAVALVVASLLRRAGLGQRLVVTRHRRIVRIASEGSTTLAVPGFHEVLEWPTAPTEIAIVVRARTADDQEVRVLATVSVDVDPPRVGMAYVDPRGVLHSALERWVAEAVQGLPAGSLIDERAGLESAIDGLRLDGLAGGVVTDVVIDEVDLLLHPGD